MASGNAGKLREMERILAAFGLGVVPQSAFGVGSAEETGATFAENALLKARHAMLATGLPAIADDSGLMVDALDGRPGVYSARFAGIGAGDDANIDKLLQELAGVEDEERGAAFHCVVCMIRPHGSAPLLASGEWRGRILHARRGSGGFGYDPVFFDANLGRSAAELTPQQKNRHSHRGKALADLVQQLGER